MNKNSESILISLFKSFFFNININNNIIFFNITSTISIINKSIIIYNNIDRNIRDNSDIPDEDSLLDIDKRRHFFQIL